MSPSARKAHLQALAILHAVTRADDRPTAQHSSRVAALAAALALGLGLAPRRVEGVYLSALVHDVGKIAVPRELILKPGKLTPEEYALVRTHASAGAQLLRDVDFPWPVETVVAQHHERLDGSGYPRGLSGEAVALEARIVSVADVFEAICDPRPYRKGQGADAALAEIRRGSGTLYDRRVVSALASLVSATVPADFWKRLEDLWREETVLRGIRAGLPAGLATAVRE